jgi:hypothetical protein
MKLPVIALLAALFFLPLAPTAAQSSSDAETVVYITKTGEKYHKSDCHHLRLSKIKTTLQEAKENGYGHCSVCKPGEGYRAPKEPPSPRATAVRCSAMTQAGTRCKRMTKSGSGCDCGSTGDKVGDL